MPDIDEIVKVYKAPEKKEWYKNRTILFAIGGFLISIILIISALLFFSSKCDNLECHIEEAMNCKETNFENTINNITMSFEIGDSCVLTKKITGLDKREPKEIVDLFLNKSMNCTPPFSRELFTTLSGGMDNCSGELKGNIYYILSITE